MRNTRRNLKERSDSILAYVAMLVHIEKTVGTVWIHGQNTAKKEIEISTIHVLKAGVFLHLYNLIESTFTNALARISEEIFSTNVSYLDLATPWQSALAFSHTKIAEPLNHEKRVEAVLSLCAIVANGAPLEPKPNVGAGNIDDKRISAIAKQLKIPIKLSSTVMKSISKKVFNDLTLLGLIKHRRNELAHGENSFAHVGKLCTAKDLKRWTLITVKYLMGLIKCLEGYMKQKGYLRVPTAGTGLAGAP